MATQLKLDEKLEELVAAIYDSPPEELIRGLARVLHQPSVSRQPRSERPWSEKDVVLITYADQIRSQTASPLRTLADFLEDHGLTDLLSCVHLLPFCPYSSDDGFSVIDYLAVDPSAGTWQDIEHLGTKTNLMFDLVLNHCSQHNEWFQRFLACDPEFADYFVTADPSDDLSAVTRPRSLPLLTQFTAADGEKSVWTTFSDDQVDLNYANPWVLLRMIDVLVDYARRGARIIRLDAIAYLWKEIGTPCIHLPQTHAIVRLMRYVLDRVAPGTLLLTETNVPHAENISYFGDGDEAHMVYQFSLPPLLLEAFLSGDTTLMNDWLTDLRPPFTDATFFNFTASHDGIGVRPLEGLVPPDRIAAMVQAMHRRGGRVGTRRNPDGTDSPYELNITYLDAIADRATISPADHAARFLASQAVMLALQGMPAVYFHSLVGSPNDQQAVRESGHNRRINRHKYDRDELDRALSDAHGLQRRVFDGYRRLLATRVQQPAFHPDAQQRVLEPPIPGILGFIRTRLAEHEQQQISVLANLTDQRLEVAANRIPHPIDLDLLDPDTLQPNFESTVPMAPFQVRWLSHRP